MKKLILLACLVAGHAWAQRPPSGSGGGLAVNGGVATNFGLSAQTCPGSAYTFCADSNGVLHWTSATGDSPMFGGGYLGDHSMPWMTNQFGLGVSVTGSGVSSLLRIQRDATYSGSLYSNPTALSVTTNVGSGVGNHENGIISTINNKSEVVSGPVMTGALLYGIYNPVNVVKTGGTMGANILCSDLGGRGTAIGPSCVGTEIDDDVAGPDTNLLRAGVDLVVAEQNGPSVDGATSIAYGFRARPSNYSPSYFTGPATLINGYFATSAKTWPGSGITNAFASDGAYAGLKLYPGYTIGKPNVANNAGASILTIAAGAAFGVQVGNYLSDTELGLASGTTATSVAVASGIVSIGLSTPLVGNMDTADTVTSTNTFNYGLLLSGHYQNVMAKEIVDDAIAQTAIGSTSTATGAHAQFLFQTDDSGGTIANMAQYSIGNTSNTPGAVTGYQQWLNYRSGTLTSEMTLNGGLGLGSSVLEGVGTIDATNIYAAGQTIVPLRGTTASIGGGALTAGACTSGSVAVTGANTTMAAIATPVTYPGDGIDWHAYISSGSIFVKVCAIIAATPTATTYIVRAIP